ncbi:MAG TPA: DUF481 domain-containing protein [Bryobacteraceae bacterium]|nr:DUF481 domain-containing protein [Bryobacteraceae bacterium]
MSARDKTDVLVLKNGDRITCEVKKLDSGVLEVGIDYVDGTISIDWRKVARLESSAMFLIKLQNGSTYAGKVVTPESLPGTAETFEIQQIQVVEPVSMPRSEVVSMTQTSVSFLQRFDGDVALGSQYSKGNSTNQYNVSSDIDYEEINWGARARYNSNLSSSSGAETATRNQTDLSAIRLLRRSNYFLTGSVGYLQSSVQGIEGQITLGFGLGVYLKNTDRVRLTLLGGPGWQRTAYTSSETEQAVQKIGVFLISSSLEAFRFKKMRLAATANVIPAVTDTGRVFINSNVSYYLKLFGKLNWNFSVYGNFDSRPPGELSGSDYGTSTGLSWSFGNR